MELPIFFNFVEVARLDQVPPGTGSVFAAADKNVAVFNVAGKLFAKWSNKENLSQADFS